MYNVECRRQGHAFPTKPPAPGEKCTRCRIIFCPVAMDHDLWCQVCGWNL